jgi:hypothetical protein
MTLKTSFRIIPDSFWRSSSPDSVSFVVPCMYHLHMIVHKNDIFHTSPNPCHTLTLSTTPTASSMTRIDLPETDTFVLPIRNLSLPPACCPVAQMLPDLP